MNAFAALKQRLEHTCAQLELREHESMSRHTSFRIGGPVSLMALPENREQAVAAVIAAREEGIEPFL